MQTEFRQSNDDDVCLADSSVTDYFWINELWRCALLFSTSIKLKASRINPLKTNNHLDTNVIKYLNTKRVGKLEKREQYKCNKKNQITHGNREPLVWSVLGEQLSPVTNVYW